ncbi:ATP-binding response regulator [Mucilaginibacter sp. KACC 22063]|uniref:ATP-binding response regulator n=1 Tax=Mucilaginibacter sp. KACC 22063 TaxID=3025666 RepID=UPI002366E74C|nr:hybrid sensor histidine kinase/response regulator [Mucilaginibacter sp. KACC 22063]WDF54316.1 hybrid sensor histidine kinase/response regulator [Mucilaginibacter sp. KACC 22063]
MILIVDDKSENLIALKKILETHNFSVDTALSGEEALRKVLKYNYKLIILDVQMPGMDGFEVAEAISGYSKTKDIPIIFLSAVKINKQFISKGYASGGRDYLIKPIDPDILVLKMRTFIKLYEQTDELNRVQHALMEEIEYRKEAESKKDEFISIASHELNTPLTSVKGYLQLAEKSFEKDNKDGTRMYLDRTKTQLNKLNQLVADLLNTSKIVSGKLEYSFREFDFEPFLDSAIDIIKQSFPHKNITKNGTADVRIHGDPLRLEQVILNYLTNAIKYSPDNDEIFVDVALMPHNKVNIKVRDQGIGIPLEKQDQLFDKFYRVEESSNRFQGLGMGLYICAEIIRRHSGTYGVESEPGKGSTFYFTIPVKSEN